MIEPGLTATVELEVADDDTAVAVHSGDVPVLATPRVVALVEEAAVAAIAWDLDPDRTTVGTKIDLDHVAATPVGRTVAATAAVTSVDGRRITFAATVSEGDTVIATATHVRAVVDRERFLGSLRA